MNEKNLKYGVIACGLIVLLVGAYFLWQSGYLPDHGSGADAIGTQLGEAGNAIDAGTTHAGNAERKIERAEDGVRNSIERVNRIATGNTAIKGGLEECLRLNRESQSIIRAVRERGATVSE